MERKEVRESRCTVEYCIPILPCVQGRVLGQVHMSEQQEGRRAQGKGSVLSAVSIVPLGEKGVKGSIYE